LNTFSELGLSELLVSTLDKIGFTTPTEVQVETLPVALAGRDLIVSAETGSGKTAAYALPILERLKDKEPVRKEGAQAEAPKPDKKSRSRQRFRRWGNEDQFEAPKTSALVVVPTRELALQVKEQFLKLNPNKSLKVLVLYGGADFLGQSHALKRGADIIIATPGRLIDFLMRGACVLNDVNMVVLDEADRLLDLGFTIQINQILDYLPVERQTVVFSATIDKRVNAVASAYLKNPHTIKINTGRIEPSTIEQHIHYLKEREKEAKLLELIQASDSGSVLVFTRTKIKATMLAERMKEMNIGVEEIHGDIRQRHRERTLQRYRNGEFQVLVATDVAARGLDVPSINQVINYDLPQSASDYVHRIGRTGRAGRSGVAHSFVSDDQRYLLSEIEKVVGRTLGDGRPTRSAGGGKARSGGGGGHRGGGGYGRSGGSSSGGGGGWGRSDFNRGERSSSSGGNWGRAKSAEGGAERGTGDREPRTPYGDSDKYVVKKNYDEPRNGERNFYGDKPSYGDRPAYGGGEGRPNRDRFVSRGDRPAYGGDRPEGEGRPARERFARPSGDRPAYGADKPASGGKPAYGDRPAYGERAAGGDRPRYGKPAFAKAKAGGGGGGYGAKHSGPKPAQKRRFD
jgi:superfamily II DNA/RNA helicase